MDSLKEQNYSPIYFLSSLGSGGLSVSFFIYFMFMIDHPKMPLPTVDFILPAIKHANSILSGLMILVLLAILILAFQHLSLLIWNIREYTKFKQTDVYHQMLNTPAEISLMAVPLTYAMTINVFFVLGAAFVPKIWTLIEYLFPLAVAGFLVVGIYGLRIFIDYFSRMIIKGDFDFVDNNNLSQMLAVFAFAMVGVGLAAPGAMSHNPITSSIAMFFSIFFVTVAVVLGILKLIIGFRSILRRGIKPESSVSLWIVIPILTLIGITIVRQTHGFAHHFNAPVNPSHLFFVSSMILSLQLLFGILGYIVMKRVGYFKTYLNGEEKSPTSYALICPGVAFFVFGMFFIYFGLIKTGILSRFSIGYFVMLLPFVYVHYKTIRTFLILNKKLLPDRLTRKMGLRLIPFRGSLMGMRKQVPVISTFSRHS